MWLTATLWAPGEVHLTPRQLPYTPLMSSLQKLPQSQALTPQALFLSKPQGHLSNKTHQGPSDAPAAPAPVRVTKLIFILPAA